MYDMNISVPAIKIQKDKNHLLKKEFDFTKKKYFYKIPVDLIEFYRQCIEHTHRHTYMH